MPIEAETSVTIWPSWAASALEWAAQNHVGDLAGIAGVVISIVGFVAAIVNIKRTRNAATAAEKAAKETQSSLRFFDTISDISAAITLMDEVKRYHRLANWDLLPDRYSILRRMLVSIRGHKRLSSDQITQIQRAMTMLGGLEKELDTARAEDRQPNLVKKNHIVSQNIEELQAILIDLQSQASEKSDG